MPRPHQPAANSGSVAVTLVKRAWGAVEVGTVAGAHHERAEQRTRLQIVLADRGGNDPLDPFGPFVAFEPLDPFGESRCPKRGASNCSLAERPWSAAKTSLEISVWTAMRSSDDTRMAPLNAPLWEATSSSCQFQVESLLRAEKIAGQYERDKKLLSDGERVHLPDGQTHEGA